MEKKGWGLASSGRSDPDLPKVKAFYQSLDGRALITRTPTKRMLNVQKQQQRARASSGQGLQKASYGRFGCKA